MIVVYMLY